MYFPMMMELQAIIPIQLKTWCMVQYVLWLHPKHAIVFYETIMFSSLQLQHKKPYKHA